MTSEEPTRYQREYEAFQRLLPGLLETHRGKYVAVHDGQVVDSGDDDIALTERVHAKYGYVPIHVGRVADPLPSPHQIPHYRVPRREGGSPCPPTAGRS